MDGDLAHGDLIDLLRRDLPAVWLRRAASARPGRPGQLRPIEVDEAATRFERFRPVLAALFPAGGWDGAVRSDLIGYEPAGLPPLLVKCDHALPMTGSVKARGGVHELLVLVERTAMAAGVLAPGDDYRRLLEGAGRSMLADTRVVVASTGNLGFSIGLVARALGMPAEVHMSHDAKRWKKDRLRSLGVQVVEHRCDYTETVGRARRAAEASGAHFVDDERSRALFVGYSVAARELAGQLDARGLVPTVDRPLVAYLPCGVGGAPGGIAAGLKQIYGDAAIAVFVEPTAAPCMLAALASGEERAISVYDLGLNNATIADGLAVPTASDLVIQAAGHQVDAAVAVPDSAMLAWVRRAWQERGLRLEPSAAVGFAAVQVLMTHPSATRLAEAVHVVWTTGGSLLPDDEFEAFLAR